MASEEKRKILFMLGANELAENRSLIIGAVKKKLEILGAAEGISVDIALFPDDRDEWRKIDRDLAEELFSLIDNAAAKPFIDLVHIEPDKGEIKAADYAAYYGSPSFMPLNFINEDKPVMIADLRV